MTAQAGSGEGSPDRGTDVGPRMPNRHVTEAGLLL